MKFAVVLFLGATLSLSFAAETEAQRGRGGGGGTSRGGGSRGGSITVPANFIADAAKAFRKDLTFSREQRDTLDKIDSTLVRKEREYRTEATTIANGIPTRAASANAELLTRVQELQTQLVDQYRVVIPENQHAVFDRNRDEFLKKRQEELARLQGRGRGGGERTRRDETTLR